MAMATLAASLASASVVQEGYVWRGSDVFCDIVNLRYAKLYTDVLVTYRKETHCSPSKAWPLYAGCMLTGVEGRELMFCHRGYNNVFARLSGRFEKVEAVSQEGRVPICGHHFAHTKPAPLIYPVIHWLMSADSVCWLCCSSCSRCRG